MFLKL